jgi:hypothetical protein
MTLTGHNGVGMLIGDEEELIAGVAGAEPVSLREKPSGEQPSMAQVLSSH